MTMTMKEAVDFLYATPKFTTKNSLDHTRQLIQLLGEPCLNRKVIHVAGSNGKGSVCCFLYHMLLADDRSVGLFTSPHLVDIRERFQINGDLISEETFLAAFFRVKRAAEEITEITGSHPTFFEFLFAMGMVIFEQAQVEYVILETGLGGRLDATNSFPSPILTVLTSISLEHTEYLGDTLEQVAAEKAGILKPTVPVVYSANEEASAAVIRKRAEDMQCPCLGIYKKDEKTDLRVIEGCMFRVDHIGETQMEISLFRDKEMCSQWVIPFSASYQAENAVVAISAMEALNLMDEKTIQQGLLQAHWPGRMQQVLPEVYLDGAHNPSGISAFVETVRTLTQEDLCAPMLLFSMVKDKDFHRSIELLTRKIPWECIAVTTIPSERGIPFEELQDTFWRDADRKAEGFDDYREALHTMLRRKKKGQKLFCTGSLYFVGALMEVLQS